MPRVVETGDGLVWRAGDSFLARVGSSGFRSDPSRPGVSEHLDAMASEGFFADGFRGVFRPTTPELRIHDQDLDGVAGEVIYGILGMGSRINDPEAFAFVCQQYNDWAAEFCESNPTRFKALACIPNHDPDAAAVALRHAADVGLVGADFDPASAVTPIFQNEWDPLWAAAAECGMPISFHTTGMGVRGQLSLDNISSFW